MKKTFPIVVSMLSAAASAFAGFTQDEAVGWYAVTDSGFAASDGLTVTRLDDGSITLALSEGESWTAVDGSDNRRSFTFAVTFNFDKITTPSSAEKMVTLNASTTTGFGLNTSGKLQGWWNAAIYSGGPTLNTTLSGVQTVVFTFSDNGSRFYKDSSTYWSASGLKGTIGDADTVTISATAANALTQFIGWTDPCYSDAAASAGAFETASTLVIPEPSAFGLLAGVGALALVAARRRRSRAK